MSIVDDFTDLNRRWKTLTGQAKPKVKWAIFFEHLNAWLSITPTDTFEVIYVDSVRRPTLYATQQEAQNILDGVRSRTGDLLSPAYQVRKYQ